MADLNGDADPDLAVTNADVNSVALPVGGSGATFDSPLGFHAGS